MQHSEQSATTPGPSPGRRVEGGAGRVFGAAALSVQRGLRALRIHYPLTGTLVVSCCLALVLFLLWRTLELYLNPQSGQERKDLVSLLVSFLTFLAQVLTGTALLIGLYFTRRTLILNQEGQVTERFTRAIDQLGATDSAGKARLEIRLGGIYALERIAKDSVKDYWMIMEILTTYLRENAPWPDTHAEQQSRTLDAEPHPRADIQAIVNVLGRSAHSQGSMGEQRRLDLRKTNLQGALLDGAHLERVLLDGAYLQRASLKGAHLDDALLYFAGFEGANLEEASLRQAALDGADLRGAFMTRANLQGASLNGAHLEGALLEGAHLERAILAGAHMQEAVLYGASFAQANLKDAHLEGANLEGATGLSGDQLKAAYRDKLTTVPAGLDTPATGRVPDAELGTPPTSA